MEKFDKNLTVLTNVLYFTTHRNFVTKESREKRRADKKANHAPCVPHRLPCPNVCVSVWCLSAQRAIARDCVVCAISDSLLDRVLSLSELPPDAPAFHFKEECEAELAKEDNPRRLYKLAQQAGKGCAAHPLPDRQHIDTVTQA